MLAKLMKYEFKATSRLLVPLYIILILFSIANRIAFRPSSSNAPVMLINVLLMFAYILLIFAILIITVVYMIVRFYKNLLTDEGYLMFTLPAKVHQLISSKLLVTVIWSIISFIIVLISLFVSFASADNLPAITHEITLAMASFNQLFGGYTALFIVEMIIMCLLSVGVNILLIYVSIAVGQLYTKHKIMGSFVAYIVITTVIQFLMMILLVIVGNIPIDANINMLFPKIFLPIAIVIAAIMGICSFIGTNYMFKKKLNLD